MTQPLRNPQRLLTVLLAALLVLPFAPALSAQEQDTTVSAGDDRLSPEARKVIAGTGLGATYLGIASWAYLAWYTRSKADAFALNNEGSFGADTYAGGADKVGHAYSNYILARGTSQLIQYGGWIDDPLYATLVANAATLGLFTGIEVKDGFHSDFGFSVRDMGANVLGNGAALLLETSPSLDRMFSLRFEYFPSDAYLRRIRERGSLNVGEDYSGQRFLVAYHLASVPGLERTRGVRWLRFVDVVGGYYTRGYLPEPEGEDPPPRQRALLVGVSLNLQQVVDEVFFSNDPTGPGYGAAHFATEVLAVPYTTLDLNAYSSTTSQPDSP